MRPLNAAELTKRLLELEGHLLKLHNKVHKSDDGPTQAEDAVQAMSFALGDLHIFNINMDCDPAEEPVEDVRTCVEPEYAETYEHYNFRLQTRIKELEAMFQRERETLRKIERKRNTKIVELQGDLEGAKAHIDKLESDLQFERDVTLKTKQKATERINELETAFKRECEGRESWKKSYYEVAEHRDKFVNENAEQYNTISAQLKTIGNQHETIKNLDERIGELNTTITMQGMEMRKQLDAIKESEAARKELQLERNQLQIDVRDWKVKAGTWEKSSLNWAESYNSFTLVVLDMLSHFDEDGVMRNESLTTPRRGAIKAVREFFNK